jgi:hypothetical protein
MWVVYERPVKGKDGPISVVCSQAEWDELDQSGGQSLIQSGIASEAEAERVARAGMPHGEKKLRQNRGSR